MNKKIKQAVVRAASYGFDIPGICVNFCLNKDKITHSEYIDFCNWAKQNYGFYYWLANRLCKARRA